MGLYYVVRFETIGDYERAMFGGPWMVGDHYVVIQNWRPYFQPEDSTISTLRVWVRLPGVPLEYYDATILTIIGNKIGKTVRLDNTTLEGSRGNFARICVEVDLAKPLLSKYRLHRRVRRIEYEGLHTICFSCGCYGHAQDACDKKAEEELEENSEIMISNPIFQNKAEDPRPEVEEDFGPWMKVSRSSRKGKRAAQPPLSVPAGSPEGEASFLGNKFNALSEEDLQGSDRVASAQKEKVVVKVNQGSGIADELNKENIPISMDVGGSDVSVSNTMMGPTSPEVEPRPAAQSATKFVSDRARAGKGKSAKPKAGVSKGPVKGGVQKTVGARSSPAVSRRTPAGPIGASGLESGTKEPVLQDPMQQDGPSSTVSSGLEAQSQKTQVLPIVGVNEAP
ncbi:hypothetical protein LINPERPRIM_LOCUS15066 [Linum perenne]